MPRMTRVSPPELAGSLPAPQASTSVTCAPPRSRCRADSPPKAPAPTPTPCIEVRCRGWAAPAAAATIGTAAVGTNARREMRRFEFMRRDDNGLPGWFVEDGRSCPSPISQAPKSGQPAQASGGTDTIVRPPYLSPSVAEQLEQQQEDVDEIEVEDQRADDGEVVAQGTRRRSHRLDLLRVVCRKADEDEDADDGEHERESGGVDEDVHDAEQENADQTHEEE